MNFCQPTVISVFISPYIFFILKVYTQFKLQDQTICQPSFEDEKNKQFPGKKRSYNSTFNENEVIDVDVSHFIEYFLII